MSRQLKTACPRPACGGTRSRSRLAGRLNLMRHLEDPRLVKDEANAKSLTSYRFSLTSISDLDDEFQRWPDEAHAVGDGAHLHRLRHKGHRDLLQVDRLPVLGRALEHLDRAGLLPRHGVRDRDRVTAAAAGATAGRAERPGDLVAG